MFCNIWSNFDLYSREKTDKKIKKKGQLFTISDD